MPLKIVRNDITKMKVDVIVNTANAEPIYSSGVDAAVYKAAGEQKLLEERQKIGVMQAGEVAITSGFNLPSSYIIHAVSPYYGDGNQGADEKLRLCYRRSLELAYEKKCKSIAFPLIATGSFGYPREEGMRIAIDEINSFLFRHKMDVYLVLFDSKSTALGYNLNPDLQEYIDKHYVYDKCEEEYGYKYYIDQADSEKEFSLDEILADENKYEKFLEDNDIAIQERMSHITDTFQQYLLYLIKLKGLTNSEVYNKAMVTKQLFSKIKQDRNYHPDKNTALRLCIGAKLNLGETKDLLLRAGYALSPSDKRDIIFSYFIENKIFDIIEIDFALENHELPCIIK